MLAVTAPWQLAVDYDSSTGVLDKAAFVDAVNAGAERVNLRQIQAGEKKQRDRLVERISEGSAADKLASPLTSALAAIPAILGGFGLVAQPDVVKNDTLLGIAVVFFALAFLLTVIPQVWKKTTTVTPARLDLVKKQARVTGLKKAVGVLMGLLIAAGLLFAVASLFFAGTSQAQNASIGDPDATETATGIEVTLIVKWTNLGTDVARVRTTVVTLPERTRVYRRTPKKTPPSSTEVTQEVKFELQDPTTIEITTEALDATGKTVGEIEQDEADVGEE